MGQVLEAISLIWRIAGKWLLIRRKPQMEMIIEWIRFVADDLDVRRHRSLIVLKSVTQSQNLRIISRKISFNFNGKHFLKNIIQQMLPRMLLTRTISFTEFLIVLMFGFYSCSWCHTNSTRQCAADGYSNGCSVPLGMEAPYKASFTPACNKHDICYGCVSILFVICRGFGFWSGQVYGVSGANWWSV